MYNFAASKFKKSMYRNDFKIGNLFDGFYLARVFVKESSQKGGNNTASADALG